MGAVWGITAPQTAGDDSTATPLATDAPTPDPISLADDTPRAATPLTVEFCDVVFRNLPILQSYLNTIKGGGGLEIRKNVKIAYRFKNDISLGVLFHIADVDPQLINSLPPTSLTNFKMHLRAAMPYYGSPFNIEAIFRDRAAPGILLYRGNAEKEFIGALMRMPPRTIDLGT